MSLRFAPAWMSIACLLGATPACLLDIEGGGQAGGGQGGEGGDGGGITSTCGDGVIDGDEACEGSDFELATCVTLGFAGGLLRCTETCTIDASGCVDTLCGNGVIDAGEDCDGGELGLATCDALGFASGLLACQADCSFDASACEPAYLAEFEQGMPAELTQTGDQPWATQTTVFQGGAAAAKSGAILANQTSGMRLALRFDAPGELSFAYRVSSEPTFDVLRFFVDDVEQAAWSGVTATAFATHTVQVPVGNHSFEWRYTKDLGISSGDDAAYVDDIKSDEGYLP